MSKRRIKVIKVIEKEGGDVKYADEFHNGRLVGLTSSPLGAKNYGPFEVWDHYAWAYVQQDKETELQEDLKCMFLLGERENTWCVHSFSVVEIDVITTLETLSETLCRSL